VALREYEGRIRIDGVEPVELEPRAHLQGIDGPKWTGEILDRASGTLLPDDDVTVTILDGEQAGLTGAASLVVESGHNIRLQGRGRLQMPNPA
jgi:hypothetical protein